MQPSKQQALMFLLGAVLVGGALGFTADRMMIRDQLCAGKASPQDLRGLLTERLGLAADQEEKVDKILDERTRQYEVVMAPIRSKMDSIKLNAREQIRVVLSPEQVQKFDDLIRELNDTTRKKEEE